MSLFIVRNDIVNMDTDAIVLPANQILEEGSGASRAIFEAAGEEKLIAACREIGECEIGKAVITPGFDLPAKYIIHAVCPKWYGGNENEEELLRSAYTSALRLATENRLESIAFPLLSTGNYGYPKDAGLEVAKKAIDAFLDDNEMDVYIVLYDGESMVASRSIFDEIESYIDDNYVGAKDQSFVIEQGSRRDKWRKLHSFERKINWIVETDDQKPESPKSAGLNDVRYSISGSEMGEVVTDYETGPNEFFRRSKSIEELIKDVKKEPTFSEYLLQLIDHKGMTDVEAYKKANVSKSVFHTIRSNRQHVPKKSTVLAFAIALELNLDGTNYLLKKAGYAFSNAILSDLIIQFFIINKKYDIFEINEILYDYNQPLLGMKTT